MTKLIVDVTVASIGAGSLFAHLCRDGRRMTGCMNPRSPGYRRC